MWTGNHDGDCLEGAADHDSPTSLGEKITELEKCIGHSMCWVIDSPDDSDLRRSIRRIRGWVAHGG